MTGCTQHTRVHAHRTYTLLTEHTPVTEYRDFNCGLLHVTSQSRWPCYGFSCSRILIIRSCASSPILAPGTFSAISSPTSVTGYSRRGSFAVRQRCAPSFGLISLRLFNRIRRREQARQNRYHAGNTDTYCRNPDVISIVRPSVRPFVRVREAAFPVS